MKLIYKSPEDTLESNCDYEEAIALFPLKSIKSIDLLSIESHAAHGCSSTLVFDNIEQKERFLTQLAEQLPIGFYP